MKETSIISEKKARNLQLLAERYHMRKAILETWQSCPVFSFAKQFRIAPQPDPEYLKDLIRRIRGNHSDLTYRGSDGFSEPAANHIYL
jgi:hypothetical protein